MIRIIAVELHQAIRITPVPMKQLLIRVQQPFAMRKSGKIIDVHYRGRVVERVGYVVVASARALGLEGCGKVVVDCGCFVVDSVAVRGAACDAEGVGAREDHEVLEGEVVGLEAGDESREVEEGVRDRSIRRIHAGGRRIPAAQQHIVGSPAELRRYRRITATIESRAATAKMSAQETTFSKHTMLTAVLI